MKEVAEKYLHENPPGLKMRWFTDGEHDLYIWRNENDELVRFQFAYGKSSEAEKMIEWFQGKGVTHSDIDDGERPGGIKRSPLVIRDGPWNPVTMLERFEKAAENIDKKIYDEVREIISEYIKN